MTVILRIRDVGGAFNRISIRPDLSPLTMAELSGGLHSLGGNVMIAHRVFPFRMCL